MQKRNVATTRARAASATHAIQLNWQYMLLVAICGTIIAAGFFFAARQHFMSMDYGFKNSKLKKQLEDLEAEKRRLVLVREVSLSPAELRKAASKARSLRVTSTPQPTLASTIAPVKSTPNATPISASDRAPAPKIIPIAYVRPTKASDLDEKQARVFTAGEKGSSMEMAAVAKIR